jgi:hypothetical protein
MDNNQVISNEVVSLVELRNNVAESNKVAKVSELGYAKGLNAFFSEVGIESWYDIDSKEISENAKFVKAERTALYAVLKAKEHTNPSTVWARVRKLAKIDVEGEPEESDKGAVHARSAMLRNIEELSALWKFNGRQESLPDEVNKAQAYISSALMALGVNLTMLSKAE